MVKSSSKNQSYEFKLLALKLMFNLSKPISTIFERKKIKMHNNFILKLIS